MFAEKNTVLSVKLKFLSAVIVALLISIFLLLQQDDTLSSEERISISFALPFDKKADRIVIQENDIEQISADEWRINNKYGIDPEMLESLFAVLAKIEIKRPVPAGLRDNVAKAFVNNQVEIKIFERNIPLMSYSITAYEGETYAMIKGADMAYSIYIPGFPVDLFKIFNIDENEWRDKRLFKTHSRTVKTFESFEGKKGNSVLSVQFETVAADSGYFRVKGLEQADQNKLIKFINNLERVRVAGFIDETKAKEAIATGIPIAVFAVEDIDPVRNARIRTFKYEDSFIGHSEIDNVYFVIEEKMLGRLFALPSDFAVKKQP